MNPFQIAEMLMYFLIIGNIFSKCVLFTLLIRNISFMTYIFLPQKGKYFSLFIWTCTFIDTNKLLLFYFKMCIMYNDWIHCPSDVRFFVRKQKCENIFLIKCLLISDIIHILQMKLALIFYSKRSEEELYRSVEKRNGSCVENHVEYIGSSFNLTNKIFLLIILSYIR